MPLLLRVLVPWAVLWTMEGTASSQPRRDDTEWAAVGSGVPGAAALHLHVGCGCSGPRGQEEPCAGTGVHGEPGPPHARPCAEPVLGFSLGLYLEEFQASVQWKGGGQQASCLARLCGLGVVLQLGVCEVVAVVGEGHLRERSWL